MDYIKLNQLQGVAANSVATLVTDQLLDLSLHSIVFTLGGTSFTKANINGIQLRVNGKDILPYISGSDLQKINAYDGDPADATKLVFNFGDPTAQTIRGQHLGNFDFSVYRYPLEIRVDIGGATAPTLKAEAWTSVPKLLMGVGFDKIEAATFRALVRSVIQPTAAVTRKGFGVSWGSQNGGRIRRVLFLHTNLTSVEYKKNSITKHDDVSVADNAFTQKQYARVPQTGLYVLDRVVDGNQGEAETTIDGNGRAWNQQFNLTFSAADTVNTFVDVHTPWEFI